MQVRRADGRPGPGSLAPANSRVSRASSALKVPSAMDCLASRSTSAKLCLLPVKRTYSAVSGSSPAGSTNSPPTRPRVS